jgi:hypothetical protein
MAENDRLPGNRRKKMNPEIIVDNIIELLKPIFAAGIISAASTSGKQLAQMLINRLQKKADENKTFQQALNNAQEAKGDSQSMDELKKQLLMEVNRDASLKKDLVLYISSLNINHNYSSAPRDVSASKGGVAIGGNVTGNINVINNNDDA